MKRNKVLLGLFVGLMTLAGGSASAQSSGGKFYEIGPSNVSGEVTSLAMGPQDPDYTTIYAGSASGGLFVRTLKSDVLRALYANDTSMSQARKDQLAGDTAVWHYIRYIRPIDGREVALPISCMIAAPDGAIYFGTGLALGARGTNYSATASQGCGIFRYNPADNSFTMLYESNDSRFYAVNDLDYIYRDNTLFLFAATPQGLFRWKVTDDEAAQGAWGATPSLQVATGVFDDVTISRAYKTVYATGPGALYKIGDATASDADVVASFTDITSSTPLGGSARIYLALSPTDHEYLYAAAVNTYGMLDKVYQTTNGQTWNILSTSSVTPFTYTSGYGSGDLVVDPTNPKRIVLSGSDVWTGQGYGEGYFQWTSVSSNEYILMAINPNSGDFMNNVFDNTSYVHSGINQILPVPAYNVDGALYYQYYFATKGGVFMSDNDMATFRSLNNGLNTLCITGIAVGPDGTILSGAVDNSCPIIEPHFTHVGGEPTLSWYDDGSMGNLNHNANVIWRVGTGGEVAISAFQQFAPQKRRTIFTTTGNGLMGRSYADYLDYMNTTTWTTGTGFMTDQIIDGPAIGKVYLWETDTNTVFKSTVRGIIDTLGYIMRNGDSIKVDSSYNGIYRGSKFRIQPGDVATFYSRGHADYPFEYTYTENKTAADTMIVSNPIQSRMVTVGGRVVGGLSGESNVSAVWYSWMPSDFTKVWNEAEHRDGLGAAPVLLEKLHYWSPILAIRRSTGSEMENVYPRNAVISNNGRVVYASAYNVVNDSSILFRISGFENIDFSDANGLSVSDSMSFINDVRKIKIDTLTYEGSKWFPRAISSIAVDPRAGEDRLILTFDGYSYGDAFPNVMEVENASTSAVIRAIPLESQPQIPAYCAMVEDSTGTLYVGTELGVFTKEGNAEWQPYLNIPEVPVKAMTQQTKRLPLRRNLTHTGINPNKYVFARTKWHRAIYFGTYGRGIFMDMTYVTDTLNEIVDSVDYTPVGIPTVSGIGLNTVSLYPNPVSTEANIVVDAVAAGTAVLRVYDLNGRCVIDRHLGFATEGENLYTVQTQGLSKGMYLVNVIIGGHTAATKMMVR